MSAGYRCPAVLQTRLGTEVGVPHPHGSASIRSHLQPVLYEFCCHSMSAVIIKAKFSFSLSLSLSLSLSFANPLTHTPTHAHADPSHVDMGSLARICTEAHLDLMPIQTGNLA